VCCSVLQCVVVCSSYPLWWGLSTLSVCCTVLHCIPVCCSVLQCVAAFSFGEAFQQHVCCSIWQCVAMCCSVLQCGAAVSFGEAFQCQMCCTELQCIAVCCSVLHLFPWVRPFKFQVCLANKSRTTLNFLDAIQPLGVYIALRGRLVLRGYYTNVICYTNVMPMPMPCRAVLCSVVIYCNAAWCSVLHLL